MKKLLLYTLLLLLIPLITLSQTLRYVSPTGSGSGDGSIGNPWSLSVGLSHMHPNTPIVMRQGVYKLEGTTMSIGQGYQSGTDSTKRAILRNYPGERVIITGSDSLAPFVAINHATKIIGLWFGGTRYQGYDRSVQFNSGGGYADGDIDSCVFWSYYGGISVSCARATIKNSIFVDMGYDPFYHAIYLSYAIGGVQEGQPIDTVNGNSAARWRAEGDTVYRNIFTSAHGGYSYHAWHMPTYQVLERCFFGSCAYGAVTSGSYHNWQHNVFFGPLTYIYQAGGDYPAGGTHFIRLIHNFLGARVNAVWGNTLTDPILGNNYLRIDSNVTTRGAQGVTADYWYSTYGGSYIDSTNYASVLGYSNTTIRRIVDSLGIQFIGKPLNVVLNNTKIVPYRDSLWNVVDTWAKVAAPAPPSFQVVDYSASIITGGVRFVWNTINETANLGFYVQRSNQPASGFVNVSSLIAGIGTPSPHSYTFSDTTVTPGTWYYRLVQVDSDGTQHPYNPVFVTYGAQHSYPFGAGS